MYSQYGIDLTEVLLTITRLAILLVAQSLAQVLSLFELVAVFTSLVSQVFCEKLLKMFGLMVQVTGL